MLKITKPQLYAIAAVVCDHLMEIEHMFIATGDCKENVTYAVSSFIPATKDAMPCTACPEGREGEGYELEFTLYLFLLDVDLSRIPAWALEEISAAIYEDMQ